MADIGDAGPRLRQMNDVLDENDRMRAEIELLRGYRDEAEADAAVARLLVDRSRLTDDEQAALQRAIDALYALEDLSPTATADDAMAAARLARLRDRLKAIKTPRDDRLKAIKTPRDDRLKAIKTPRDDRLKAGEDQRLADYGKWLRTPYCGGRGCRCKEQKQAEK